jgi:polyhydroxyalkanoate synthase subunit PhaC
MNAQPLSVTSPLSVYTLRHMDRLRQARGRVLEQVGFGPKETPYQVLHTEAGLTLRKYGQDIPDGPAVLLVPAPIKKAYIWDLSPSVSVVRRWLEKGYQVYLAEWTPGNDPELGLDDYGDRLLGACQRAIASDSGNTRIILAGHSLGGVLAAVFACLHPEMIRAIVLLEAPLHFGGDCFAPLVRATPDARTIAQAFRQVPGTFLSEVSMMASPQAFQQERLLDRYLSIANPYAMATHMRVERWTHDESPLPGRLFAEVVEWLYREDRFMRGTLAIGQHQIGPRDLLAPLLNVIAPRSVVIPPSSVLPFHEVAASQAKCVLRYDGDIGVNLQHVGVLVGVNAHVRIWPAIFEWLETESKGLPS